MLDQIIDSYEQRQINQSKYEEDTAKSQLKYKSAISQYSLIGLLKFAKI